MEKQKPDRDLIVLVSTLFFAGHVPLLQGTTASVLACLVYYFLFNNSVAFVVFTVIMAVVAVPISSVAERKLKKKDPREVVIDDFAGMCVALLFIPHEVSYVFVVFFLFRICDGLKFYPLKKIEKLKGGWGIVGDDIVAGIYAGVIFRVSLGILNFISSRGV